MSIPPQSRVLWPATNPDRNSSSKGEHFPIFEANGILRHIVLSVMFVGLFLALNRPEVLVITHLGQIAWYPATGLGLALMLAINPRYALLVAFAGGLAGVLIYHQPVWTASGTVGTVGIGAAYALAAHVLRGPLHIDLGLRRRRDVVRYVAVTSIAASVSTVIGVSCLLADGATTWKELWPTCLGWFCGDEIGILGVAPFLLIHVAPRVRGYLSGGEKTEQPPNSVEVRKFTLSTFLEAAAQTVTLTVAIWIMFRPNGRFYVGFIPMIWIAMRHGVRRVATTLLAMNFGIVVALHFYPPTADHLLSVGLVMFVLSAAGLLVGSEVSERHRMSCDLLVQANYLNSLVQNSPLGIVALDQDGRVELANGAFEELFLLSHGEADGRNLADLFPAGATSEREVHLPELLSTKIKTNQSIRRRRKDGTILHLELHTVPVDRGRTRGSYTIYKDISVQVKSEEDLRQAHADAEIVINSVPSILIGLDSRSKITRWNRTAEQIFNLERHEVLGKVLGNCGIQWLRPDISNLFDTCLSERREGRLEELMFQKSDRLHSLGLSTKWVHFPSRGTGELLILGADTTERRDLEGQLQQAQKLEAIGQLAAGIAHEINTPAQFVGDNIAFLKDNWASLQQLIASATRMSGEARAGSVAEETISQFEQASADIDFLLTEVPLALEQSRDGVNRITMIVRAMKEFSHPGSREKQAIDLNRAIQTTVAVARNEWKYVSEVSTDLSPELPLVSCFAGELNQVLLILIVNAAHAIGDVVGTTGNKGSITITTTQKDSAVEIAVRDSGAGIPEAIRSRIFEPFFTTKPVGKGTGQGLTLAYATVKKHDGKIWFESEMNKGTTFFVRLPLETETSVASDPGSKS
jgi:PAS domain S-box-containing protein